MRMISLLAALTLVAACGDDKDDTAQGHTGALDSDHPALALTGDETAGETVFSTICATCHGADGTGGSGPNITGVTSGLSDAEIVTIIAEGKGSMPAQGLDDQEIADVLAYIRATWG